MNKRKRGHNRTLGFWLALESIVVTLAAVAPFALLHLVNRFYWLRASTVLALGMLVIMGSVVGITATLFSRRFNQMVSGLTRGLRAVADGDFSQRLEPEEGGPLQPAYEDFNKMSMELQSIQTLRADFINHFSHEFKTPITAIKGFAELLREPRSFWTSPPAWPTWPTAPCCSPSWSPSSASRRSAPTLWTSRSSGAPSSSPPPGRKSGSPSPPTWSRRSTRAMRS